MGASLKKIINSLKNHFLVAMPGLHDENFSGSVVYICEHNAEGAMGLIINQQLDIPAKAVFDRLDLEHTNDQGDELIFDGGPVQQDRGFILHSLEYNAGDTLVVDNEIGMTASLGIIRELAAGTGPNNSLFALGYAGWGAGQLDNEMQENAWLSVDPDLDLIFNEVVDGKWDKALEKVGVNAALLSTESGHA